MNSKRTRVDGLELALGPILGKERGDEKLCKPVQCAVQVLGGDLEVVVGMLLAGERVGTAAVRRQKLAVVILARVLVFRRQSERGGESAVVRARW